jgi:tetratricopeptide (TPR) repeat protein
MTGQAGDRALKCGRYFEAIELYSRAINLHSANATTRYQKVRALVSKGIYSAAVQEAFIAVRVAPKNVWAWHYLGIACLQAGCFSRATTSFETAFVLAEPGRVPTGLRDGLAMSHTESGSAKAADERKSPEVCCMAASTISQQQIEGIIRLAEEMQWPYLHKVREHARRIYDDVSTGRCWITFLHD